MANKAHDLMGDGYARGYPKDNMLMRIQYRTAHALLWACEEYPGSVDLAKAVCTRYQNEGCPELTSYDAFIKETISMQGKEAKKLPPSTIEPIEYPMPDDLDDILGGIELTIPG